MADAGFGQQEVGSGGVGFQFAAKLGHVDAQVVRLENSRKRCPAPRPL